MNKEVHVLDALKVGDVVVLGGVKSDVMVVTPEFVGLSPLGNGNYIAKYSVSHLKDKEYILQKPLTMPEKGAKKLLELAGFKVTR